jgi:hypothetical protein
MVMMKVTKMKEEKKEEERGMRPQARGETCRSACVCVCVFRWGREGGINFIVCLLLVVRPLWEEAKQKGEVGTEKKKQRPKKYTTHAPVG